MRVLAIDNENAPHSPRLLAVTALAFDADLSKPVDPQTFVETVELLAT